MRRLLAFLLMLGLASTAHAQRGPSAEDLKAPPELPELSAPSKILGMLPQNEAENILVLDLSNGGRVRIAMRPDAAPKHIERIKTLTRQGFYDGTIFHRVIPGFMAQGGDPTGTGTGGSELPNLEAEFNELPHVRGAVAMARAQSEDSANSQFYIVFQPVMKLDRTYTIWGRVIGGMNWVDAIEQGEPPQNPTQIVQASIEADEKPAPAPRSPVSAEALDGVLNDLGVALPGSTLPTSQPN
jgi:peptidylprolyl isomerase